jgi:hypothetical protein
LSGERIDVARFQHGQLWLTGSLRSKEGSNWNNTILRPQLQDRPCDTKINTFSGLNTNFSIGVSHERNIGDSPR